MQGGVNNGGQPVAEYKDILVEENINSHPENSRNRAEAIAQENPSLPDSNPNFAKFIGTSTAMQKVYTLIQKTAIHHTPVFITGETGTGKEICAQSIHSYSPRHQAPFIVLNCAALSFDLFDSALFGHVKGAFTGALSSRKGAIAKAENGTLFLDEICDMPLAIQAKLLRFAQNYTYQAVGSDEVKRANLRLICATNRNPETEVKNQTFRQDLYYRLFITHIHMPPLRMREGDILDLTTHYLSHYNTLYNKNFQGLGDTAMEYFYRYHWPGNVRELQNLLNRLVQLNHGKQLRTSMLPDNIVTSAYHNNKSTNMTASAGGLSVDTPPAYIPLWQIEKNAIEQAITICGGNITQAAAMLDVAPSTIYRKLQNWAEK